MTFREIAVPQAELHLEPTLVCGQAFRWRVDPDGWWSCVLTARNAAGKGTPFLLRLRQVDAQTLALDPATPEALNLARDYLRLDLDLQALAAQFADADPLLHSALTQFAGLRVLRQDPVENLFSFLCTSCAPLYRIRKGIAGLCRAYGERVGNDYAFPSVPALAAASIDEMRGFGLGYRARYLQESACQVEASGGAAWLLSLRQAPYAEAKAALMSLTGVGAKIADCVCLFSLDKDEAIPVDTHIRRVAQRFLDKGIASKSLTPSEYARIGDTLRARFGQYAGWAQQYLFFDDVYDKSAWSVYEALYHTAGEETECPPAPNSGGA